MNPRDRFHATLAGRPRDRAAVTPLFMRWAAEHVDLTYRDYYLTGERVAEAQIAVARAFETDMVCAISDPWTESSAYGMSFDYPPDATGVPRDYLLSSVDDARCLPPLDLDADRPQQRLRGIIRMAAEVGPTHPVVGWIEGPIAQYCDLRGMEGAMMDLIDSPDAFAVAAEHLVREGARFAGAQIDAGADVIGIGDAAASIIGPELYRTIVLPWQRRLIEDVHRAGARVKLHICGDLRPIFADVCRSGADIIDLDWMVPVAWARNVAGPDQVLAGNIDPAAVLLRGTAVQVAGAAAQCLAEGGDRFMLQPGCEVPHGTPPAKVHALVAASRNAASGQCSDSSLSSCSPGT